MSVGYIYVLSNSAMPGLYKIGFTNRDVKSRAQELSAATGVPSPFEVEYYCLTQDVEIIEAEVHKRLAKHQSGKEFFSVSLTHAVDIIDSLTQEIMPDRYSTVRRTGFDNSGRTLYLCPTCGAKNETPQKCLSCGREYIG
ncbi:MAG: GIY-YIG nuclease family protein [Desulfobacteraceae bacterium]|nr:GIY-YIG nuclease family protein [Desulfobacteraceae bacterium]